MEHKESIKANPSGWMKDSGPSGDVVLSSRVRFARNINDLPFPHVAAPETLEKVIDFVNDVFANSKLEWKFDLIRMNELTPLERQYLVEKHLVSPQLIQEGRTSAVILDEDELISIMVNEEDHLRIQCLFSGLQIEESWEISNKVDDLLEERLDYAFCEKRGYLTSCPTNVGTGMRSSVMLHLPALGLLNQVGKIFAPITQLGLTVRGIFGEGSESIGNIFQLSNQITLGRAEEEIINNLNILTKQIVDQERNARELLLKETRHQLEDRVWRAYGLLTNARILSSKETIVLLSDLKLGIELGIIKDIDAKIFKQLIVFTRPAFLQVANNDEIAPVERDLKRAILVRESLTKMKPQEG